MQGGPLSWHIQESAEGEQRWRADEIDRGMEGARGARHVSRINVACAASGRQRQGACTQCRMQRAGGDTPLALAVWRVQVLVGFVHGERELAQHQRDQRQHAQAVDPLIAALCY